jgi:hypothetical protein
MKKIYLLVLLAQVFCSAKAQDLIVTKEGDSLNCRIKKMSAEYIHFAFRHKGELRQTLLLKSEVRYVQKGYYTVSEVPEEIKEKVRYKRFTAGFGGGLSYVVTPAGETNGLSSYLEELRTGHHYAVNGSFYFNEYLGLGLRYSYFNTRHQLDNVYAVYPDGSTRNGTISDNITCNLIAPALTTRLISGSRKFVFRSDFAAGLFTYHNEGKAFDSFELRGSTFSLMWGLGAESMLSSDVSLVFDFHYVSATLYELSGTYQGRNRVIRYDRGNGAGVSRIDASVGVKIHL